MQYTLVRNIFSRQKRFEISDIHEQVAYQVSKKRGGLLSSVFVLSSDKTSRQVTIKRHYKPFKTNYYFFEDGQQIAKLTRKFRFLRSHFILTFFDGMVYQIQCGTWRKNYTFLEGEEVVAELKRQPLKMQRTYELTCLEMDYHEILMASVVALDQIFDQDNSG